VGRAIARGFDGLRNFEFSYVGFENIKAITRGFDGFDKKIVSYVGIENLSKPSKPSAVVLMALINLSPRGPLSCLGLKLTFFGNQRFFEVRSHQSRQN